MSSPKRIPKKTESKPPMRESRHQSDETISVPQATIYRLAAEARCDHRTVITFLSGGRVYPMTADAIRRAALSLGIKLPTDLKGP